MPHSPEPRVASFGHQRAHVHGHELRALSTGWQAASSPADLHTDTQRLDSLSWIPARVPGTAAGALRDAALWRPDEPRDFDEDDWWFRTSFDAEPVAPGEEVSLRLDGIASVAEVFLNGERILESDSMFAAHTVALGARLRSAADGGARGNELAIRCRALAPLLAAPRRPRARWRTRLVAERNLRFFRTMLIGRAPGFAPGPAAVGPWRGVHIERRRRLAIEELVLRPRIDADSGVLAISARLRPLDGQRLRAVEVELDGPSGTHRSQLALSGPAEEPTARGELTVAAIERWWPHTHGEPALHDVRLLVDADTPDTQIVVEAGRVGFRELAFGSSPSHELERDGLDLHVNGVRVFARGAVWTPIDPITMAPCERDLQAALLQAREAGMNMLRLPGTGAYETTSFHDLCDELGILVWQDLMFANFDYPLADEHFRATVTREASDVLGALGGRASLAVVCGNSEVEQQVAMLGLDPALGRCELFEELLPGLVRESGVDAAYVPSTPCGGELPFRADRGIANYYGVGGYRRPLEDARRADVRFAAECLAFANVPDEDADAQTGSPRDVGADWDFRDVSDHYLGLLFDVDARALRESDRERYLELSRVATGEVMAEVFGEWRRAGSPCGGGLMLWLRDVLPGAGWGVIDHRGVPKTAYHHLRRALAPVAVWTVDEGLGGVVAHVANDRPEPLIASLRVALYRDGELRVEQAATAIELAPHSQREWNVETIIGRFVDAGWAYRFGAPAAHAIVVSLERDRDAWSGSGVISQAVRFPAGRPLEREPPEQLGIAVEQTPLADGQVRLELSSRRLAYGVHIHASGYLASDDGFSIEPGGVRSVTLRPSGTEASRENGTVGAVNLYGRLELAVRCNPR
ncbi:MAG: glycoside hydrolase family 2 protein [Solirubrobacteraceae bacterium]